MNRWLVILLLIGIPAQADWVWLQPGVEYRSATIEGKILHQIRFGPERLTLFHPRKPALVGAISTSTKALVVMNASYFDEAKQPLGYLIIEGRVVNRTIHPGGAFGGVLFVRDGQAQIVARDRFQPGGEQLALQCGPRLLSRGQPVTGLHPTQPKARSGIALDRQGKIILYACDYANGLTLAELQQILARPENQGGVRAVEALNLDGGSSTQLVLNHPKVKVTLPALVPVPVAIGVQ